MKFNRKIFNILTGTLPVLLFCTLIALPSGMHLEVCFGSNGNLDLLSGFCSGNSEPQCQQTAAAFCTNCQYEDCRDIVVGCSSQDKMVSPVKSADINNLKDDSELSQQVGDTTQILFYSLNQLSIRSFLSFKEKNLASSNLLAASTIVLLI